MRRRTDVNQLISQRIELAVLIKDDFFILQKTQCPSKSSDFISTETFYLVDVEDCPNLFRLEGLV